MAIVYKTLRLDEGEHDTDTHSVKVWKETEFSVVADSAAKVTFHEEGFEDVTIEIDHNEGLDGDFEGIGNSGGRVYMTRGQKEGEENEVVISIEGYNWKGSGKVEITWTEENFIWKYNKTDFWKEFYGEGLKTIVNYIDPSITTTGVESANVKIKEVKFYFKACELSEPDAEKGGPAYKVPQYSEGGKITSEINPGWDVEISPNFNVNLGFSAGSVYASAARWVKRAIPWNYGWDRCAGDLIADVKYLYFGKERKVELLLSEVNYGGSPVAAGLKLEFASGATWNAFFNNFMVGAFPGYKNRALPCTSLEATTNKKTGLISASVPACGGSFLFATRILYPEYPVDILADKIKKRLGSITTYDQFVEDKESVGKDGFVTKAEGISYFDGHIICARVTGAASFGADVELERRAEPDFKSLGLEEVVRARGIEPSLRRGEVFDFAEWRLKVPANMTREERTLKIRFMPTEWHYGMPMTFRRVEPYKIATNGAEYYHEEEYTDSPLFAYPGIRKGGEGERFTNILPTFEETEMTIEQPPQNGVYADAPRSLSFYWNEVEPQQLKWRVYGGGTVTFTAEPYHTGSDVADWITVTPEGKVSVKPNTNLESRQAIIHLSTGIEGEVTGAVWVEQGGIYGSKEHLSVAPSSLCFSYDAGTQFVAVTAVEAGEITVATDADWITATADGEITVAANETAESRAGTVTFAGTAYSIEPVKVAVAQAGKPVSTEPSISIMPSNLNFSCDAGAQFVAITTNGITIASVSYSDWDWIRIEEWPNKIAVTENESKEARGGWVMWEGSNGMLASIGIYQEGARSCLEPSLSVAPSNLNFSYGAGTRVVAVAAVEAGEITVATDADWLTATADGEITVAANEALEARAGTVTFYSSELGVAEVPVSISQAGKPASADPSLSVAPSSLNFSYGAGTQFVAVTAVEAGEITVATDADWLTATADGEITVAANETLEARAGTVTFAGTADGVEPVTVAVAQDAFPEEKKALLIYPTAAEWNAVGGVQEIEIYPVAAGEITVATDADWLTATADGEITVAANVETTARAGTVTWTGSNGVSATLSVSQSAARAIPALYLGRLKISGA